MKYLLFFLILFSSSLLLANDAKQSEAISKEIAQQFMSPFCPGRSLADCPSRKADQLKTEIEDKVNQGIAKEKILNDLLTEYGEEYNALPAWEGRDSLAWWVPIGFFCLLLVGIVLWFYRQSKKSH